MPLVHVGIRPTHPLKRQNAAMMLRKEDAKEMLPGGGYRIWTERMLQSGCNQEVTEIKRLDDLLYCETCGEFFSQNQFKGEIDETES